MVGLSGTLAVVRLRDDNRARQADEPQSCFASEKIVDGFVRLSLIARTTALRS